jgi:hypothetical protein
MDDCKKGGRRQRELLALWRIDVNEKGKASGSLLRARVAMEINKPLRRCLFLRDEVRKANVWYEIQYEKLPFFCKSCGIMGHSDLVCLNLALRDSNGRLPYDIELRAPDDSKKKKQASFGEMASGMFSAGSHPSRTSGRSASPGRSKGKSSENSTNHVELGEKISSLLKKKMEHSHRDEEGGSGVKKRDLDGKAGQHHRKRKPVTDGEVAGRGVHATGEQHGNCAIGSCELLAKPAPGLE